MKTSTMRISLLSIWLSVSILSVTAQVCSTQGTCKYKNMREAIDAGLAREASHEWHKIQWRTDVQKALREAQTQSKPIFVFFVVKQRAPSPSGWVGPQNDFGKT